jgi:hypothetical protein
MGRVPKRLWTQIWPIWMGRSVLYPLCFLTFAVTGWESLHHWTRRRKKKISTLPACDYRVNEATWVRGCSASSPAPVFRENRLQLCVLHILGGGLGAQLKVLDAACCLIWRTSRIGLDVRPPNSSLMTEVKERIVRTALSRSSPPPPGSTLEG